MLITRGRRATWVLVGLIVLTGCATSKLQQETSGRLSDLGRTTEDIRRDLTALGREVAELRAQLEALRGDSLDTFRGVETRHREALRALERRLAAVGKRVEGFAEALSGLEASVGGLADQVARVEAVSPATPSGGAGSKGGRFGSRSASAPPSAEELFDRAMERFRSGELGQSVLDFEEFVGKYPGHPLIGSAQFWIGEAYFRAREYQQAAVEYEKAIDVAPNGEKTPEALLKLGLAHRALKREERAREVWARLLRDFPETEAAQKARTTLR